MKKQNVNPVMLPATGNTNGKWYSRIASNVNGLTRAVQNQLVLLLMSNIVLFSLAKAENEKPKKEPVKAKKPTRRQAAAIKSETKRGLRALLTLPAPPYTIIMLAAGLIKLTPAELCNYISDRLIRIASIPAYAACSPTVTFLQDILDELTPLANMGRNIPSTDRATMEMLTKQLRDNFTICLLSCIVLSGGNLSLFALLNVKTKSKGTRNNRRLPAPIMKLNTKKGENTGGVSCKPKRYAFSYSIAYGTGNDVSTYQIKTGSSSQLITDLTGGELVNFIMWANTGKQAGFPCAAQPIRVPYN